MSASKNKVLASLWFLLVLYGNYLALQLVARGVIISNAVRFCFVSEKRKLRMLWHMPML